MGLKCFFSINDFLIFFYFLISRLKDETRDLRSELRVLNPQIVSIYFFLY